MDWTVKIEWEEDGCYLLLFSEEGHGLKAGEIQPRYRIADPEQLYDRVKGAIGPWLRERDEALAIGRGQWHTAWDIERAFKCDPDESAGAYELSDPKHPDFHSVHADIWDAREGK